MTYFRVTKWPGPVSKRKVGKPQNTSSSEWKQKSQNKTEWKQLDEAYIQ